MRRGGGEVQQPITHRKSMLVVLRIDSERLGSEALSFVNHCCTEKNRKLNTYSRYYTHTRTDTAVRARQLPTLLLLRLTQSNFHSRNRRRPTMYARISFPRIDSARRCSITERLAGSCGLSYWLGSLSWLSNSSMPAPPCPESILVAVSWTGA